MCLERSVTLVTTIFPDIVLVPFVFKSFTFQLSETVIRNKFLATFVAVGNISSTGSQLGSGPRFAEFTVFADPTLH